MSFLQQLDDDLKGALKASESLKVSVLRMTKAALKNQQIEKGGDLSQEEITAVLSTLAKQRRESIEQFTKGGREDLAEKERLELVILRSYLPEQISPEELDVIIMEAIKETTATGTKDMGKVMRLVMSRVKSTADGKMVSQRVQHLLGPA
jgi:uncharacterized protein YqeY